MKIDTDLFVALGIVAVLLLFVALTERGPCVTDMECERARATGEKR